MNNNTNHNLNIIFIFQHSLVAWSGY